MGPTWIDTKTRKQSAPRNVRYAIADSEMLERLIISTDYAMQQKVDGVRLTIEINEEGIKGYNKRGAQAIVSPWLHDELSALPRIPWKFDGEYAPGGYYIFDLMNAPVESLAAKTFSERMDILNVMIGTWGAEKVHVVETWIDPKDKLKGLIKLSLMDAEGAIFRPQKSPVHFVGQVYKYKFRNTVDAVVLNKTRDKASIEVGLYRDNNLVSIGKCSVNGTVSRGDVVEISYRHLSDNGRLIEPVFSRVRDDKFPYACVWDQLKEGKHLQDESLLDRQTSNIARSLNLGAEELRQITTTL